MKRSVAVFGLCMLLSVGLIACTNPGESPNPTATTMPTLSATPELVATPTPVPVPSPTPTPVPTSTLAPTATPVPTATPTSAQLTRTYANPRFGLSFRYPESWPVSSETSQVVELTSGDQGVSASFAVDILQSSTSLDVYTRRVLEASRRRLNGFQVVSTTGTTLDEVPGIEHRITYTREGQNYAGKLQVAANGRLGFVLLLASRESSFALHERTLDAVQASLSLPSPNFRPPSPGISGDRIVTTELDEKTGATTSSASVYEAGVPTLYVRVQMRNIPLDSMVQLRWRKVGVDGSQGGEIAQSTVRVDGSVPAWSKAEPPGGFTPGFYQVIIFVNGQFVEFVSFSVVTKIGEEFTDAESYAEWAAFLMLGGDTKAALQAANKAIEMDPELVGAYETRYMIFLTQCDFPKALADIDKVVELVPDDPSAYLIRSTIHWSSNDDAKALAAVEEVISLDETFDSAYNMRALIRTTQGAHDAALVDINKALELRESLSPANYDLLDTRAYIYLRMKRYADAQADFDKALAVGFEVPHVLLGAGLASAGLGDLEKARDLLTRGFTSIDDSLRPGFTIEALTCYDRQLTDLVAQARDTLAKLPPEAD